MTTYFGRVLSAFAQRFNYRFAWVEGDDKVGDAKLIVAHDGLIPESLPAYRGTHIIRDPRDLIVSGYFYHLRTKEAWCVSPGPHNTDIDPGVSYQNHLRSLARENGIYYEMTHISGDEIRKMLDWDYSRDEFLELRFEDVLGDEAQVFARIFQWYGFGSAESAEGARLADRYSANRKRRVLDYLHRNRPITRGSRIGHWKEYFTSDLKTEFKSLFGDAVVRLGYETSNDW